MTNFKAILLAALIILGIAIERAGAQPCPPSTCAGLCDLLTGKSRR
ncbi:hypothetical protein [Aliiroseovarius sp.]|nr:hypothetical protein [Aliiroseovarius sp.]